MALYDLRKKRMDESFLDAFAKSFEIGQQARRMNQMQEMNQMHYDATLGARGFRRMDEDEIKEYLPTTKRSGYETTDGGYVGVPEGGYFKEGYIFNKGGDIIGSYLPGYEPQRIKKSGDVIQIGKMFYRYNKELAKNLGLKSAADEDIFNDIQEKLKQGTLKGKVIPQTIRIGNQTFRYIPTLEEKTGIGAQAPLAAPSQTAPTPQVTGQNKALMRQAIISAIANNEPKDTILKGIQEEGFKEGDFQDLLNDYDQTLSPVRRRFLFPLLGNVGVSNLIGGISAMIDKRKEERRRGVL